MADPLAVALVYLNRRERTVAEVRARLRRADFDEAEADAAVQELIELGYLDDRRFARLFVEDKRTLEQWGAERIARSLSERGVDRELIAQALADADGGAGASGEMDRALELLQRRFPAAPRERRERERAFGVLVRKGYDSELAGDAIRAWIARSA